MGSRCQLAYLAAAAFPVRPRNGENLVLIAVAVHLGAEDVRTVWQVIAIADVTAVRNAWTTSVTRLTRSGVKLQVAFLVGTSTRLFALDVRAWW